MKRAGLLLFPLALLSTLLIYQGFVNATVAQTLAAISRPFLSLFGSPSTIVSVEATPLFLIEKNATFLAIAIAMIFCLAGLWSEFKYTRAYGKNWMSAGVISLSVVLLLLNARLLAWNA